MTNDYAHGYMDPDQDHTAARADLVREWAGLLNRADVLILDTETTGLDWPEIVDIAVIDTRGYRRLNRLVLPAQSDIEAGAVAVHGITPEKLREAQAPTFTALAPRLQQLVTGASDILIYNADFDIASVRVSLKNNELPDDLGNMIAGKARCIMLDYAFLAGSWHDYWEGWAWHKLVNAARWENVPRAGAHRALADCKMVLGIMRSIVARMAAA